MSLTLKDLFIFDKTIPLNRQKFNQMRPASLADLVEVLKQEGAEVHEMGEDDFPGAQTGRYLVLPLDGTTPK